ncbi:MAG: aminoacyl-tRNA hydrolase [Gemmatimonadetes bacterium]|nr:aminoacyl-tRNA hydrolase [Gemmatimonadota bacterium]
MSERGASDLIRIDDSLAIQADELTYRASRAGGPGGQHVNRASTRVELLWDVRCSPSLTGEQRARILEKLAKRISHEGALRLVAGGARSQYQNKLAVTARFRALVARALRVPKPRKKTRPPRAAEEARLREKKRRAHAKRLRSRVEPED